MPAIYNTATPTAGTDSRPLVLSVTEAAATLGISRSLAYDLVRTGAIPSIRLGRRLVVPRSGLLTLIETAVRPDHAAAVPTRFRPLD
jgi:excisionase family DNA binding protein